MTSTRDILEELASGKLTIDEAEKKLRYASLTSVGNIGMIDINRFVLAGW